MRDDVQHSKIYVIFRPVGTRGEADIKMSCPVDEPVMITSVGAGSDGPDGQHVVIEYGPDNRPPEVRANDALAAHQREVEVRESRERNIIRRFTASARKSIVIAQQEARRLGRDRIGTEHLLLGVIGTGETAELEALGIMPVDLRADIERFAPRGDGPVSGHIPFTPHARGALRLAAQEAEMLETPGQTEAPGGWRLGTEHGSATIGTGHLLLGLIHEGGGMATDVLEQRGVTLEGMRGQVVARRVSATGTPAQREPHWDLLVRFVIGAASDAEARGVLDQVLARLDRPLPLQRDPVIEPAMRDGIWVAKVWPVQVSYSPDDAENRCRWVSSFFGIGPAWVSCQSRSVVRWDWPPPIWTRAPGEDDELLHPAVQAVMISCEVKPA